MNVTIAGASGFVGSHLLENLLEDSDFKIRGLSRSPKESSEENLQWKVLDLFSMTSAIEALKDTDVAIYLVHSMVPSSRLFQGSFYDTDLLLADNFVRACRKNNVKHIIYLGGLLPKGHISPHLRSRIEVEEVIKNSGIDYTIARSGLVVGDKGSSFKILKNLVFNLPAMVLPQWTKTPTQIVFVKDLTRLFVQFIKDPQFKNQTINTVTEEKLIYTDLIKKLARHFKKKKLYINLPLNITSFSKLWVTLFGRANYSLVSPLIDSLTCDFSNVEPDPAIQKHMKYPKYDDMLRTIHPPQSERKARKKRTKKIRKESKVQSVQRLSEDVKTFSHIQDVSDLYCKWLSNYMSFMVNVDNHNTVIYFRFFLMKKPLIVLQKDEQSVTEKRIKFKIKEGLLVNKQNTGSLEFRFIAEKKYLLCMIHNYVPRLHWYLYRYTQAKVHAFIMKRFSAYINQKNRY